MGYLDLTIINPDHSLVGQEGDVIKFQVDGVKLIATIGDIRDMTTTCGDLLNISRSMLNDNELAGALYKNGILAFELERR